jgi:hypothetical protein
VGTVGKCGSIIEAAATTQSAINDSAQRKPTAGLALSFLFTLHVVQLCEMEHVSPFARAKGRQSETLNVSPPPLVLLRMPVVLNPDLHIIYLLDAADRRGARPRGTGLRGVPCALCCAAGACGGVRPQTSRLTLIACCKLFLCIMDHTLGTFGPYHAPAVEPRGLATSCRTSPLPVLRARSRSSRISLARRTYQERSDVITNSSESHQKAIRGQS